MWPQEHKVCAQCVGDEFRFSHYLLLSVFSMQMYFSNNEYYRQIEKVAVQTYPPCSEDSATTCFWNMYDDRPVLFVYTIYSKYVKQLVQSELNPQSIAIVTPFPFINHLSTIINSSLTYLTSL